MSRRGGPRSSGDDLAYGEMPQRWDRDTFERFGGGGGSGAPPRRYEEEDYRFTVRERDRGGRREVTVMEREREQSRGPPGRGRFEEQVRFSEEEQRRAPSRRRRTDRELFGDVDPREIAEMAVARYEKPRESWREIDIEERERVARPDLRRRQSSLDTYDRRPIPRYEREEVRVPMYSPMPVPVPVPYLAAVPYDGYNQRRPPQYEPQVEYRDVQVHRERSVHRSPPKSHASKSVRSSKTKSVARSESSSSSSSSETIEEEKSVHASTHHRGGSTANKSFHESFHESIHEGGDSKSINESVHKSKAPSTHVSRRSKTTTRPKSVAESFHESIHESVHDDRKSFHESISESIHETEKKFKKGRTKMPKRLVRKEAIMDLGYPFDEDESFFMLRIALEKEQIDEVMDLSKEYFNGEKQSVYKFEENVDEASSPPPAPERERAHEEVIRTEWINPPTIVGDTRSNYTRARSRHESPGARSGATRRSGRSRARSRANNEDEVFEERKTVVEERSNTLASPPPVPHAPPPPSGRNSEFFEEKKTTVVEERSPSHIRSHSSHHHGGGGSLVLQEREYRSDRDIQAEIRMLEKERRALRLERDADERRELALRLRDRHEDEFGVIEYQERRPREYLEIEREPEKNVLRIEKDKKERRDARLIRAAMATLT